MKKPQLFSYQLSFEQTLGKNLIIKRTQAYSRDTYWGQEDGARLDYSWINSAQRMGDSVFGLARLGWESEWEGEIFQKKRMLLSEREKLMLSRAVNGLSN